jgi:hypothetical protein
VVYALPVLFLAALGGGVFVLTRDHKENKPPVVATADPTPSAVVSAAPTVSAPATVSAAVSAVPVASSAPSAQASAAPTTTAKRVNPRPKLQADPDYDPGLDGKIRH